MNPHRFQRIDVPYNQIPWYRRRWALLITMLLFLPLTILIALTGDIYAKKDGNVYRFKDSASLQLVFMCIVFIIFGLLIANSR